jgi:rubrerythrin
MCVKMYPAYKAVAELQDEKKVVTSMHYALESEKIHATLYGDALVSAANKAHLPN